MRSYFMQLQVVTIVFYPATISGNLYEKIVLPGYVDRRELTKGLFLCEASSSTSFCRQVRQLCDTSTGKARCICAEGWKGSRCQIRIDEPQLDLPTKMPTSSRVGSACTLSSNCATDNSYCLEGQCQCQPGFTPRKGNCINVNECEQRAFNACHRDALCIDTEGSYECNCKLGFEDTNATLPGRQCRQTNECEIGAHNCDAATQICLDHRPPKKWECVPRTAAPTRTFLPTPLPTSIPASPTPIPANTPTIALPTFILTIASKAAEATNNPTSQLTPSAPTNIPTAYATTLTPTDTPTTALPTLNPTIAPVTAVPINNPTDTTITTEPTSIPANQPNTAAPTNISTANPTTVAPIIPPTDIPNTASPTLIPTMLPTTALPTDNPTANPTTVAPIIPPTDIPTTASPTLIPTMLPTTALPTDNPTANPTTVAPTISPTDIPTTASPTLIPTNVPTTALPTDNPTANPTTGAPTMSPTDIPTTASPTLIPTTAFPTKIPTASPTTVAPTNIPTKAPTTKSPTFLICKASDPGATVVSFEDFENENLSGWTNAMIYNATKILFTKFVHFGKDKKGIQIKPLKTVTLPFGTMNVRVEFKFYEIATWDGEKFFVSVNGVKVDMGNFMYNKIEAANGTSNNITWFHNSTTPITNLGFTQYDQKHDVNMNIPWSLFTSDTLALQFEVSLDQGMSDESAGIDDLKIIACP